jgi:hypothetical protein
MQVRHRERREDEARSGARVWPHPKVSPALHDPRWIHDDIDHGAHDFVDDDHHERWRGNHQISSGPAIKLPNGNARFDVRIVKAEAIMPPGVDPAVEDDFNRSAALLKDVGGWIEVDDRGIVQRSELNQAAKNPNVPVRLLMARTSLARIILPAEPVGLGASWEARKELKIYGFEMQQVDRYTLIDKVGDELKLRVEIVQTAPKQTLTFVEEGVEFALRSLSMSADGDVILNLNALEGSASVQGQSAEVLTVKTVQSKEKIKLNSAFQLDMNVRYEASKQKAQAIEEAATKTTAGQK